MDEKDILQLANNWLEQGKKIAIATVVETGGSSPRPRGSQLVVDAEGNFEGSISGGCVEGTVIDEAKQIIKTKEPRILEFGVINEMDWEVGLACGGKVRIYVEAVIDEKR